MEAMWKFLTMAKLKHAVQKEIHNNKPGQKYIERSHDNSVLLLVIYK